METIISACISAGVTLVICLLNNHGQQEKTRALMEYKLDELTKRVDEHNHVVERTYSIEKSADECCGTDHITDPDTGSGNRLVHLLSDSN